MHPRLRERYQTHGPEGLGDSELLAIVLGTGRAGVGVLALAQSVLDDAGGLDRLRQSPLEAWIRWLGPARGTKAHAALELTRRAAAVDRPIVRTASDAHTLLGPVLRGLDAEEFHALYLDRAHRLISSRRLSRGSDALTVVEPRMVFRPAVQLGAAAIIVAHNHPSGDPTPSSTDELTTERLVRAAALLGIELLDHLVVGSDRFVSIRSPR